MSCLSFSLRNYCDKDVHGAAMKRPDQRSIIHGIDISNDIEFSHFDKVINVSFSVVWRFLVFILKNVSTSTWAGKWLLFFFFVFFLCVCVYVKPEFGCIVSDLSPLQYTIVHYIRLY